MEIPRYINVDIHLKPGGYFAELCKDDIFAGAEYERTTYLNVNGLFGPKMESLVRSATSPARINIAEGFKIDLLYSVPMEKEGSWVAMCMDDKQRLIVSDQYGGIYRFPIPTAGKKVDPASIEQITYATERDDPGVHAISPIHKLGLLTTCSNFAEQKRFFLPGKR